MSRTSAKISVKLSQTGNIKNGAVYRTMTSDSFSSQEKIEYHCAFSKTVAETPSDLKG